MTVVRIPESRDEVVLCLHDIVSRFSKVHPGHVFCYVRNVTRPVFVTSCQLVIGKTGEPPVFVVKGEVRDHEFVCWPATWQAKTDDVLVNLHEDGEGIVISAERKPVLVMYL